MLYWQEIKEENNNVNNNYGKGNCFLSNNLRKAHIEECYLCKEEEISFMINYLRKNDRIKIGFNEELNLVWILKMIKDKKNKIRKGGNIGTVFFDDVTYDCDKVKEYNIDNIIHIKKIEDIYK